MPKENTTRYAVLGLLSITPCSGYDLKKMSDMSISHFWNENYGHIYPVLRSLEADGMATRETRQTPGRPPRSVYQITEAGRRALGEWLQKPVEYHPYRMELLLKLFFAADVPPENVREKLLRERRLNEERLQTYDGIGKMLKNTEPHRSQKALPLWLATLDYGTRLATMSVEWCDQTMRSLELTEPGSGSPADAPLKRTPRKGRK